MTCFPSAKFQLDFPGALIPEGAVDATALGDHFETALSSRRCLWAPMAESSALFLAVGVGTMLRVVILHKSMTGWKLTRK